MRKEFGLRAPEVQIGLAAHDFTLGFHAPRVVLTRAQQGGALDDPVRTFSEWDSAADTEAYGGL